MAASATAATLNTPVGLAVDKSGNLYIADQGNNVVRKVSAGGTITTFAGKGTQGYSGNGGPATSAQLNGPQGVAVDSSGNVYIADTLNSVIREVTPNGIIQTIAGRAAPVIRAMADSLPPRNSAARPRSAWILRAISMSPIPARAFAKSSPAASSTPSRARARADIGRWRNRNQRQVQRRDRSHGGFQRQCLHRGQLRTTRSASLTFAGSNLSIAAVTNGASNQTGSIAPGEVIVIYGSNIGASTLTGYQLTPGGQVSTSIAGTSVYVNGRPRQCSIRRSIRFPPSFLSVSQDLPLRSSSSTRDRPPRR